MSGQAPTKVFPADPAAAPAPGAGGGAGAKLKAVDKKWWLGGAALLTVALAATVGRSDPTEDDADDPELDTSETDAYNDLQASIESLGDAISDIPRPIKPTPAQPGNPHPPKSGPRVGGPKVGGGKGRETYRVQHGDTLKSIAKAKKVKGGAARLYALNRDVIVRAAQQHKDPHPKTTRKLYPGTTLVIRLRADR